MGKCNTLDGNKWNSEINGNGDGEIDIGQEGTKGLFEGEHKKDGKKAELAGKCREHSIWFVVTKNRHLYVGGFVNNKKIEGTRFNLDELCSVGASPTNGGEDWIATKT